MAVNLGPAFENPCWFHLRTPMSFHPIPGSKFFAQFRQATENHIEQSA